MLAAGLAGLDWKSEDLGAAPEAVREAVQRASSASGLIVVGGDGTLSLVAEALVSLGLTERLAVGLIPGGTCNDVARVLGIPRPPASDAAGWSRLVSAAAAGPVRTLDLGLVGQRLFVNHAGIGRSHDTSLRLSKRKAWLRRARVPGPLVSLVHSLDTALRFRPIRCAVTVDGRRLGDRELYMALVLNGPYFSGGLAITTDVAMDDGLLDFALVHAEGKARLLRWLAGASLQIGRSAGRSSAGGGPASAPPDFVEVVRGRRLDLDTAEPVWPQHDGEPPAAEGVRRVRFQVHPAKLRVRVIS